MGMPSRTKRGEEDGSGDKNANGDGSRHCHCYKAACPVRRQRSNDDTDKNDALV